MPHEDLPAHLTITEFCAWARVGRTKTYELMNAGELPSRKIGRNTLIPREEALRWLDAQPVYRPMRERR